MRLLLDSGISPKARDELRGLGHDVLWTGDFETDPGDKAILAQAFEEQRVLVTLDKDFGELAIVQRMPHSGIIRLVDLRAKSHTSICDIVLSRYGEELQRGAIVTVEPDRVRIRPPEV